MLTPELPLSGSSAPIETSARHLGLLAKRDVVVMGLLVVIPLVAMSAAGLAGYPLLTGDDVTQSFPLSVLSGEIIAHGHLPVYDPYIWSGAPLLAGANAHALLPTTLLFVFLPHLAAWVIAEALTLAAAAIGCFLLLRRNGCRTLAGALGGATFGLGGFVSSQIVHVDFVSASAALIWCLVALDGIAKGSPRARPLWALALAASVSYIGLSGSPDIAIDVVVATALYGGNLLLLARGRRMACVAWAALGGVAGLAVSAVQWLPTAEFITASERAHPGYSFIASGSVSAAELLVSLVPHLLGGGPVGLEAYTGPYSLAELDAYCGVLSLVAVVVLATRWRSAFAGRWRVWYLVGGLGVVLALGSHTPLEHLLIHLPLVGEQRLPGRALILFSLASSMLLGYWIEDELNRDPGRVARAERVSLVSGLVPLGVVLGLVAATAVAAKPYGGLLEALPGSAWSLRSVAPYLVVVTVITLAAASVVILAPRLSRRWLGRAIAAVVIADLVVFTANQSSLAPVYAKALTTGSSLQRQVAENISGGGRFLVVDPARLAGVALDEVGGSDLNVLSGLTSAQGYGSLTWAPYETATGTHSLDDVNPAALATGAFDSLDVRVLLTVPRELSIARSETEVAPGAGPGSPPGLDAPPIAGVGPVLSPIALLPGATANRWFGRTISVKSVTLEFSSPAPSRRDLAAIGRDIRFVSASGAVKTATGLGVVISEPGTQTVVDTFKLRRRFIGIVASNPYGVPVRVTSLTVTASSEISYDLDGAISAYLTAPHWVPAGTIGPFAVFENTRALGPFSSPNGGTKGLRVRVVQSSPWTPSETVAITAGAPGSVVRSVADIPGWRATGNHDGRSRVITLRRDGLVQAFSVPRGTTIVTFTYEAPGLRTGLVTSAGGLVLMLLLALAGLVGRRRRLGQGRRAGRFLLR